jgi:hypothetical protein
MSARSQAEGSRPPTARPSAAAAGYPEGIIQAPASGRAGKRAAGREGRGRRGALQQIARSDYIPQGEGHQVIRSCQKGDEEAAARQVNATTLEAGHLRGRIPERVPRAPHPRVGLADQRSRLTAAELDIVHVSIRARRRLAAPTYWQTAEYGFYDVCWRPPYPINLDDHESRVIAGPDDAPVRILRAAGRRPRWRR